MAPPDWKPAPRVVDRQAIARARLERPWCEIPSCGRHGATFHHVLPRGERGDDDPRNGIMLCGDGTTGCHGLAEARDPTVRAEIGRVLLARADTIEYLDLKLGGLDRALDYLRRNYPC